MDIDALLKSFDAYRLKRKLTERSLSQAVFKNTYWSTTRRKQAERLKADAATLHKYIKDFPVHPEPSVSPSDDDTAGGAQ